jgi:uncharacterized protein
MSMDNQFKPTKTINRIEILDAIRGLAVFGILLSNILIIGGYYVTNYSILEKMHLVKLNYGIFIFSYYAIIGKAYPIFCMLFGISFYMQYKKYKDGEKSFVKFFLWRMLLLFIIGVMHVFIWPGDVVHYYAVISIFLIPFRKFKARNILIVSIVLFVVAITIGLSGEFMHKQDHTEQEERVASYQFEGVNFYELKDKVQNEGLQGMWFFNKQQYNILYSIERFKTSVMWVLALFLLGIFLYIKEFITTRMYHWKYLVSFLIIGLGGKTLAMFVSYHLRIIEHVFLSLFVISLFGIIYKSKLGKKLLSFFNPVGRMAFTNYVLQSILASLIFYGIGLGLFAEIPLYGIYLISFGILFIQTIFSIYWLKKFKFGPIEWLWRTLTYNKNLKLKNIK